MEQPDETSWLQAIHEHIYIYICIYDGLICILGQRCNAYLPCLMYQAIWPERATSINNDFIRNYENAEVLESACPEFGDSSYINW